MKVGLYGIRGVYNFGCEAIVRGVYQFINSIYPESEIIYFSYSADFDKAALADLNIEIRPIIYNKKIANRLINKIFRIFHINYRYLMFDANKVIDSVDLFLSIGGDIYTIPKVLRKKRRYLFYNSLVDFCNRAIKKGKPVIVYGASVGPWGEYKVAVNYYINALSKYKAILCRERESVVYLRKFGFKNVLFFPDPAFQVRGENKYVKKKYIGINLSPLAFNEVYGNHGIVYIKGLAKLMDLLWEKYEIDILFIPHVISKAPDDNDLWFMEKIKDNMRYKNHVQIADVSKGFLGAKEHIAECRAVIAARMHCAINAVEENIPTIFVSYSQKSIGMCKYIYGDCDMLVDLQKMDQDLFKVLDKALEGEENIARRLKLRNDEIQQYYKENVEHIKEILSIKNG